MGLHIGGNGITGMRYGGRDAVEARWNASAVWPDTPADPWPTKPYLQLANGERIEVLEGTYTPEPAWHQPGGQVLISAGSTCSLLYPDTRSPGVSLTYALQSGARIVYTADDAFRAYDKNGNLLALDQPFPDYPGAYNLSLFYAYAGDTLMMGFWWSYPNYIRNDRKASAGVPGYGTSLRADQYIGVTDENIAILHDFAMAMTGGSQ